MSIKKKDVDIWVHGKLYFELYQKDNKPYWVLLSDKNNEITKVLISDGSYDEVEKEHCQY